MLKINDPAKIREKSRKKSQKRKRNEFDKHQVDESKKNRKTKLDELLASGCIDARALGKTCKLCNKLYVKSEDVAIDTVLKNTETVSGFSYDKRSNSIYWQLPCSSCQNEIKRKSRSEGTRVFDDAQVDTLRRHLIMTTNYMRTILNQLREQFHGKCAACGIQTVRGSGSGFRQESLTDMYPKKRTHADPSCGIEDMRLVCLACQFMQHRLNWNDEFRDSFIEIQQAPHKPKNLSPLNEDELSYFIETKNCNSGRTVELKRQLIKRDGRHCQYTGVEMRFEPGYWNSVSFDRLDSQIKRYNFENTHLVCENINYIKKRAITEDELKDWIAHVRSHNFVFQHDTRQ